jgi:hypothetical protein
MSDTMATMIADGLEKLDIESVLIERPNLSGICLLMTDMMNEGNVPDELKNLVLERVSGNDNIWQNYPLYTGSYSYPLPCPESIEVPIPALDHYYEMGLTRDIARAQWAYHNLPRWTGDYGSIRWDALDWVIDYLRANPTCLSIDVRV